MKKRLISTLVIISYLSTQSIGVFAEELKNSYEGSSKSVVESKEGSQVSSKLLDEVYLNSSKASSGAGDSADTAVKTFQEALDLVSDYGSIYVDGEVDIPDDVQMPNKLIFIKQQEGGDKAKLKFEKKLYLNNELYIRNVDLEFSSSDKDCIFINQYSLELTNSEIIGEPNIFLGAEDKDFNSGEGSALRILNDVASSNPIGNITLGGKDKHVIDHSTVTLRGVNVNGVIDGSNTTVSSNILVEDSLALNKVKSVSKINIYDNVILDVNNGLENIKELYDNGTIKLNNGANIEADYIYGSIILDVKIPSNENLIEGNYIKNKRITGDIVLSDNLIREGYRINTSFQDNFINFNILNRATNIATDYNPIIKNLSKIVIKEGETADLEIGVEGWDFEDGDITEQIIFPNIDTKNLSTGKHEIEYKIIDSNNNTTVENRVIYVLPKDAVYEEPKIISENEIELKVGQVDIFNSGHKLVGITVPVGTSSINVVGEAGKPQAGQDGKYTITYEFKDNDNNISKVEKIVTVTNRLPEISANDITIEAGEAIDLLTDSRISLSAKDYEDGDEKENIVVENDGGLNEKNPISGKYIVTYKVIDKDGNVARKNINVLVNSDKKDTTINKIDLIGATRYDTAAKISKEGWTSANTVILVNGYDEHLVDGLTATPLASALDAPILLSEIKSIPKSTLDEIERLKPSNIIVIGGSGVISDSVIKELNNFDKNITVKRIGGQDRYETCLNIAKELDSIVPINKIYVGAGNGEPDSLSISPVAGRDKAPIILTSKNSLDVNTYNYLKSKNLSDAYFIGGEGVISDEVIKQVNNIVSSNVLGNRIDGINRNETNANVIKKFYPESTLNGVVVAKDLTLVDALSVGPFAAKKDMPVILAENKLCEEQESVLESKTSNNLYQAGGGINKDVIKKVEEILK